MIPDKLIVLADTSGKILAACMRDEQTPGAPTQVTLVASKNQVVREVEIPAVFSKAGLNVDLFEKYRLKHADGYGELIPHDINKGSQ